MAPENKENKDNSESFYKSFRMIHCSGCLDRDERECHASKDDIEECIQAASPLEREVSK